MKYNTENQSPKVFTPLRLILIAVALIVAIVSFFGVTGKNDDPNWQVVQYPWGKVEVVNRAGYYLKWFGNVWTYPKNYHFEFSKEKTIESPTDEATTVTFNDGGTAEMDTMIRFSSPSQVDDQLNFHRLFAGSHRNVKNAIWGHISNVLKATGPLMSASEHQSARNGEFRQVADEQLRNGLYEMRRVEKKLDVLDEKGDNIRVFATEIILDKDGKAKISQVSPYKTMGINITQFSITESLYDAQTQKQFATKKDSFLKAETAKAEREQETQQRLLAIEKGEREKAESEAQANKLKASAVIEAQKQKEVAELDAQKQKNVAETEGAKLLAVAQLQKQQAETEATRNLEVAKLARQTAEENAKAVVTAANAEKERLSLAGAISERDRVLAEIEKAKAIGVAEQLAKINVPQFIINGGGGDKNGSNLTENLMNLRLLEAANLLGSRPADSRAAK